MTLCEFSDDAMNLEGDGTVAILGALADAEVCRFFEHRIEIKAEDVGMAGKWVDGFAFATQQGQALWDHFELACLFSCSLRPKVDSASVSRRFWRGHVPDVPDVPHLRKQKNVNGTYAADEGW